MKKIILTFILALSCAGSLTANHTNNYSSSIYPIQCAPQLRDSLETMKKLPEVQQLIAQIQQEGPIRLEVSNFVLAEQFGAYWDTENRVICVNLGTRSDKGKIIGSILFEMHNASVNRELLHLDHLASLGQISRDSYVEAVEHLEFQNSKRASYIADIGIKAGLFPASAHLNTYDTFKEHFEIQIWAGHSAWIARSYDQIAPTKTFRPVYYTR